ncbi:MAG TPA: IclR family transcriptional regulator [Acidobacteriota bacterium]|nr:IclR family transcriptional regulator [Acidobacteriota bacterium]
MINSVIKAFQAIEFLVSAKKCDLARLSRHLGFPKSTAHRLLLTLASAGYVEQDPETLTYSVSMKLVELGWKVRENTHVVEIAHPYMVKLSEKTGETVNLGILDGLEVICLDKVTSKQILRQDQPIGTRSRAHCTAFGKALLAFLPEEERDQLIKGGSIKPCTVKSMSAPKALYKELELIRERGYSVDDEEFCEGIRCVGALIFDHRGEAIAGLSVAGPTVRINKENINKLAKLVMETAGFISKKLGARVQ